MSNVDHVYCTVYVLSSASVAPPDLLSRNYVKMFPMNQNVSPAFSVKWQIGSSQSCIVVMVEKPLRQHVCKNYEVFMQIKGFPLTTAILQSQNICYYYKLNNKLHSHEFLLANIPVLIAC